MSTLQLEELKKVLHYDPDTGVFTWVALRRGGRKNNPGTVAGSKESRGYIRIRYKGTLYWAHRLAWFYMCGEWPKQLDHIDEIKSNNRWGNLRLATHSENGQNRSHGQSNNKSGFQGVSWHSIGSRWCAQIHILGKHISLGLYDTPEEAHEAYLAAKEKHHLFWENKNV
jgi:hypothetical protein